MSHPSAMNDDFDDDDDYSDGEGNGVWKTIRKHLNFYRIHVMF
jgi:hypothetical protein